MIRLNKKFPQFVQIMKTRFVPLNTHFRPNDVVTFGRHGGSVQYQSIREQYVNPLELSEALYEDLSAYAKPEHRRVVIDYNMADVPGGRVYFPNPGCVAVVSAKNELVGDVSFNYAAGRMLEPEQNSIFRMRHFPDPKHLAGTAFSMLTGGGGAGNYAHWLIDSLARLQLLRWSGRLDEVDYFLVPKLKCDFQQDSLRYLGIALSKIVEVDVGGHFSADRMLATTAPRDRSVIIPKWIVDFYREQMLGHPDVQDTGQHHLYVARSDSGIRNVLNEPELVEMLARYDFTSVELSKYSFIEKVRLFASAKRLIAVHGAGLVNVIFSPQKSQLLELYPDQYVLSTYADLAASVGLDYQHMLCPCSAPASDAMQGQKVHVTVSIPDVEAAVQRMIEERKGP